MRRLVLVFAGICLASCGAALYLSCSDNSSVPTLESPEWFLSGWRPDHKNSNPSPGSATISELTDSVIIDLLGANAPYYTKNFTGTWRCDTVGLWHGRTVVDLYYEIRIPKYESLVDSITYRAIKAIAMRTTGDKFRLLYESQTEAVGTHFERSTFVTVDNVKILCTRSRIDGTGHMFDEEYWVWDDFQKVPRVLDVLRAFFAGQAGVLPPHHAVWDGGFIDIKSLSLTSVVRRTEDSNCCPTAGTITIKYKMENGWILVDYSRYNAEGRNMRGGEAPKQLTDSIYFKQQTHEFHGESFSSPLNRPDWQYFNAHELGYYPAPAAMPLDSLIDGYVRGVVNGLIYGDARKATFTWSVDTLGTLHGYSIVRALYGVQNTSGGISGGKLIAVQLGVALYRLVYLGVVKQPDSELALDEVESVGNDSVLCVKGSLNGLGTYPNNYWLWLTESEVPVSLYQEWVLTESLHQIASKHLPPGLTARNHKGTWDFHKLAYETYTWRKDDSDKKPTGGKLKIQFGIRDNRLVPVGFSFNPLETLTATN